MNVYRIHIVPHNNKLKEGASVEVFIRALDESKAVQTALAEIPALTEFATINVHRIPNGVIIDGS